MIAARFLSVLTLSFMSICSLGLCPSSRAKASGRPEAQSNDSPFESKDYSFESSGVTLVGRLFTSSNAHRPFPVVIYVTGSGDDDINSGGYPRALAKAFAPAGIALFTYDKRGVGKSQGTYSETNYEERARDTVAAFHFVKTLPEVDSAHVGIWGISQAGWVIAMSAQQAKGVDFVILVSPAGVSPKRQVEFYLQNEWRRAGMTEDEVRAASVLHETLFQYYSGRISNIDAQKAVNDANQRGILGKYRQAGFREEVPKDLKLPSLAELSALDKKDPTELELYRAPSTTAVYYEYYLTLTMPILVVYGDKDTLVPVSESMEILQKAFTENKNRRYEFKVFHDVDHGIQPPGSPYLLPGYPEFLRDWILTTIRKETVAARHHSVLP